MDRTLALIGRAHQGDKEARDTLFEENTGLIYSVARRFLGRGVEMEDLFQIGSIGLLKAVDKFDMSFDVHGSSAANLRFHRNFIHECLHKCKSHA